MFKDKKFRTIFMIQMIIPWVVLAFGMPAIYFFFSSGETYNSGNYGQDYIIYNTAFHIAYSLALWTCRLNIVAQLGIGVMSVVMIIVNEIRGTNGQYGIGRKLILFFCSGPCTIGGIFLMMIVELFTYAQSV